jgi:nuclear pore complex protein Nup205
MNEFLLKQPVCSKFNLTLNSTYQQQPQKNIESCNNKIFKLLSVIELSEQVPEALNLNYFDLNLTEKVINSCKYKSDFTGINNAVIQLHDVKQIQGILMNELSIDSNISQSKLSIIQEIKSILNNIIERNQFQLRYAAKRRFVDSFKIFAESFVLFTTADIFNINLKYQFIISLMKELLNKVFFEDVIVELTYPIAGLLFTLMCNLRAIVQESLKQQLSTQAVSIISNSFENSIPLQQHRVFLNSSDFNEILIKLIEYLINSSKILTKNNSF